MQRVSGFGRLTGVWAARAMPMGSGSARERCRTQCRCRRQNGRFALRVTARSLNRYFHAGLDMTVLEYLQRLRIEVAFRLLPQTRRPLAQIVSDVGYADLRVFNALFQCRTGMTAAASCRRAA